MTVNLRTDDAVADLGLGESLPVVAVDRVSATSDTTYEPAAHDDLMLRLVAFDVVERYRAARRQCGYSYP